MKLSSLSLNVIAKRTAAVLLVGAAASAHAGIMTEFSTPANGWTMAASEDNVGAGGYVNPGYGGQLFDAEYLFYKQVGSVLYLGLQSGFNLDTGNVTYGGKTYYAGDLALSFDNDPTTWEYGVDFGLLTKDYSGNFVNTAAGSNGIDPAGLYSVTTWNNNILFPASNPFAIDDGSRITSVGFTNETKSGGESVGGSLSYYRIVSFDLASLGFANIPSMHWTMSCGNDAINYTPVPEPGTLSLIGAGLLGLVALRRRRAVVRAD